MESAAALESSVMECAAALKLLEVQGLLEVQLAMAVEAELQWLEP